MSRLRKTHPLSYLFLLIVTALYAFPLLNLLNVALKEKSEFLRHPLKLTESWAFHNFRDAWLKADFGHYLFNSLYYTATATLLSLLFALLAAFPISRKYTKGSNFFYLFFCTGLFLPNALVPQFILMFKLGLYNNPLSFILTNINFFTIFMLMVGYFKSLPQDLDHAASVDGCGYFRFLFAIILPLIRPVVATGTILISIGVWNNIVGAIVYFSDSKLYPMVLGLFRFSGQYRSDWTMIACATMIVAFPLILLYVLLQKQFVEGAVTGAVKL